ncbi:MAG: prolyl oligopeptidase family serine peptidase [Phycisphaerales bacterium]|nr:prolyl oligopeptidase family serine peptidase [Phycisphaerales bacterium]
MIIRTTVGLLAAGVVCLVLGAGAPGRVLDSARASEPAPAPRGPQDGVKGDATPPDKQSGDKKDADEKLTLERLFPDKSYFGPSARSTAFSADGRFGAFLYHAWTERRHGFDLYIYDTKTGQVRRMTSVGRLAEFQADTREVRDDREKKAKKAGITLERLAREQADRLGWNDDAPSGAGSGEGGTDGGAEQGAAIPPGPCELTLDRADDGVITGEVRVWLVRLPLSKGSFDAGTRALKAEVADEKLGVKGSLSLTRDADGLIGELVLEEPALKLGLKLAPKPETEPGTKPDAKENAKGEKKPEVGPRGVLGATGERLTLGDVVLDDDAEINDEKDGKRPDKRAPRYGGVQGFEWSPVASEMLLITGGDVYRLVIDEAAWEAPIERPKVEASEEPAPEGKAEDAKPEDGKADDANAGESNDESTQATDADVGGPPDDAKPEDAGDAKQGKKKPEIKPVEPYRGELTRLTRTRESESDVQYLPDSSGYTYLRDGALLRVTFGDHRIVQLDPELKDGEKMVGYKLSPDQKRLVFLANRGDDFWGAGHQVTIVNYRDRFARAEQVTRHVSDDPWPEAYSSVYLYDLTGHEKEEGTLERVFTKRISGPRDILRVPEWAPDSSRVAFAAFEQKTDLIKILEAGFVDEKKADKKDAKKDDKAAEPGEAKAGDADKTQGGDDDQSGDQTGDKSGEKGDKQEGDKAADKKAEEEKPEFKIENAKVVYEFLHFGGPNTPGMVQPQYLPDSRRMVFLTELSGFRQLHLLDPRYQQLTQLTQGQFEVYPFDLSEDHTKLFATATAGDPDQEQVFSIDTETGAMTKLSTDEGVYSSVAVSNDGTHLLANRVDFGALNELQAITTGQAPVTTVLTDSHPEEAHKLTAVSPEYFTYENRHGQTIHGHMFKPKDWTPEDKRPLLIYVYGGPLGEQKMATRGSFNTSSYGFARYMTEVHGWVTATIDPRGASGYGAVFEKANFEQVGKPQTEDLVDGANWLVEHAGVDKAKMGLHGWSFGGFQTQMVMYSEPDAFAVGIAGAGPTEWQNYNSWYSTGTIGPGEVGKPVLEKYSLLPLAKNLKGHLLLIHGMEDDNVLYQDTVRVYRELLKADKEVNVELFLDPTGHHGLGGDVKTLGRFRKYEDFLIRYLGEGKPAEKAPEPETPKADEAPAPPEPEKAADNEAQGNGGSTEGGV